MRLLRRLTRVAPGAPTLDRLLVELARARQAAERKAAVRRARLGGLDAIARHLDEARLRTERRLPRLHLHALVLAGCRKEPGLGGVGALDLQDLDEPGAEGRVVDGDERLDAAMEVAGHPVGARDVDLVFAAVREVKRARVLEETIDERAHLDGLADAGHARAQAADAAHEQRDGHARLRRAVEGLADVALDERVHLGDDARGPAGARMLDLASDETEDDLMEAERRDREPVPSRGRAVPGEQVEEARDVFADVGAGREQWV